ncbi:hypothetical protein GCM10027396_18450 [Insolitispirillum peregrinum]
MKKGVDGGVLRQYKAPPDDEGDGNDAENAGKFNGLAGCDNGLADTVSGFGTMRLDAPAAN